MDARRTRIVDIDSGLGLHLTIDRRASLTDLTLAVNHLCATAEERVDPTAVVLSLGGTPIAATDPSGTGTMDDRPWPGPVNIRDVNRWERAVSRLERLSAMSIGVAGGVCGGPALDLLLATDYRIATIDLRLSLPINDGQFWPGMAVYRLTHQVGPARARQLVLWGNAVTADQAQSMALVDEVTADPIAATQSAVVMLGRIAGPDLAIRRQLVNEAVTVGAEEALGVHLAACDRELRRLAGRAANECTSDPATAPDGPNAG